MRATRGERLPVPKPLVQTMAKSTQKVIGGYQLAAKIGEGKYARVFKAVKPGQPGAFALKTIRSEFIPKSGPTMRWLKKLLQELPGLKHPNIIQVVDGGFDGDRPYLVMEQVKGRTVTEVVATDGPMETQQGLKMLNQLAQALKFAHGRGLLHGDIKPSNVFLCSDDKFRLSDFALKRALTEEPPSEEFVATFKLRPDEKSADGKEEPAKMTAEDLYRKKSGRSTGSAALDLPMDTLGLAETFLAAVGVDVPERTTLLRSQRSKLAETVNDLVLEGKLTGHLANIVRRLITEEGYGSIDALVVDLISARVFSRQSFPGAMKAGAEAALDETVIAAPGEEEEEEKAAPRKKGTQTLQKEDIEREIAAAQAKPADVFQGPQVFLFIWHDEHEGIFRMIDDGEKVTLGRDPDLADIPILDRGISRCHCSIENKGGELTVADAGSSNGTYVNGKKVIELPLKPEDEIKIGAARVYLRLRPDEARKPED